MQLHADLKPALWGALGGAVAMSILGFSWGGWVTSSTAETLAKQHASKAVVAVLAPICADNFRRGPDSPGQLVELKKASSWQQSAFIEKGGWAKTPGSTSINSATMTACAEMILALKQ